MIKKLAKCLGVLLGVSVGSCAQTGQEPYKTPGEQLDDTQTVREIKSHLYRIAEGDIIHVAIDRGIVQLSGFVKTEAIKKEAEILALKSKGIRDVINSIIVRTSSSYIEECAIVGGLRVK
jgi:osmotically-inducible protein OsmY